MKLVSPAFLTVVGVQLLLTLTMGSINIALPVIQSDLSASSATLTWLVALYQLGFALVLVLGGRLGDIHGHQQMLLVGLGAFTAANVMAMVAPNAEVLLGARLLQGVAGGISAPQVLGIIQRMFTGARRSSAFGVFMVAGAVGFVSGQIVTGGLMSADPLDLGWRWSLVFVTPLAIAVLAGVWRVVPSYEAQGRASIDMLGVLLAGLTAVLILFPLIQGRASGWPWWILAMLAGSVPALTLFVRYEARVEHAGRAPLLRMELFRLRTFAIGNSLAVLVGLIGFSVTVFSTIALQAGFGLSPLEAAVVTAVNPLGNVVGSVVAARLLSRIGRRVFAWGGFLLAMSVVALIAGLEVFGDPRPGFLMPGLFLFGFALAFPLVAGMSVTMSEVPGAHAGAASGVQQTVSQMTSAVGIAVVGNVFYGALGAGTTEGDYVDALVATASIALVPCVVLALASRLLPRTISGLQAARADSADTWRARRRAAVVQR